VIATEEDVYSHSDFTESLDYEGEIGIIIGKAGFRIDEKDAMDHVWGYTIINGGSHLPKNSQLNSDDCWTDVTARERQRDHKQFFVGKSADTFCPMVYLPTVMGNSSQADEKLFYRVQSPFQQLSYLRSCVFRHT